MRPKIDHVYQGQGYGCGATVEVVRRLRLSPEVEVVATVYHRENVVAARLYRSIGFLPWEPTWALPGSHDVYLRLPD